jgi:response regulator of citrate/malate metabolism
LEQEEIKLIKDGNLYQYQRLMMNIKESKLIILDHFAEKQLMLNMLKQCQMHKYSNMIIMVTRIKYGYFHDD